MTGAPVTTLPMAALADPMAYADGVPHDELARRRREAPVAWVAEPPLWRHRGDKRYAIRGSGFWAVTRHATAVAVSRQPQIFSSALRGAFLADPTSPEDLERTRQLLINMDAPEHTGLRRLVTGAFTPAAIGRLQESIRHHARALVDRVRARSEFDGVRDLAAEMPLLVLADVLGMPAEDRGLIFAWSNNLVGFDDPEYGAGDVDAYNRTFAEAFAYARALARDKRRRPDDGLASRLLACELDGRRLSDAEFSQLWVLLVVAGNETTRHLLSGGLHALVECPEERDRLVADPGLVPSAVEELLRWVSPIMQFRRTATRAVELDGQPIAEGDKVVVYYVSANRDEGVFAAPDRLDLARTPNPHLAFGVGPHFCLGAALARVEAATLLDALRPHLSRLELSGPVVRLRSNFMNGIKAMPARWAS